MLTSYPARTLITRIRPLHPSTCLLLLLRRPPPLLSPLHHHHPSARPLTSSAPLRKKKDKSSPHTTVSEKSGQGPASGNVPVDPLDFSAFEAAIERILESLKAELAKLRHTGRSPEVIEALRVKLVKGSKDTVALGEISQVIPRGRNLLVAVGEKDVCSRSPETPPPSPPPPPRKNPETNIRTNPPLPPQKAFKTYSLRPSICPILSQPTTITDLSARNIHPASPTYTRLPRCSASGSVEAGGIRPDGAEGSSGGAKEETEGDGAGEGCEAGFAEEGGETVGES